MAWERWLGQAVSRAATPRPRKLSTREPIGPNALNTAPLRLAIAPAVLLAAPAQAAGGLDGAHLSPLWGLPFAGILLSIALGPLIAPGLWHRHYGKVALFWALALLAPMALVLGAETALAALVHALLAEFLPFILMLLALFTIAGGIMLRGTLPGTPLANTAMLAFGAAIASIAGTTGASMVLVRPMIRANAQRRHNAHVMIFFIFLVSNIGGALSPLGDPPLFLGFLRGVDFFWPLKALWPQTLFCVLALLALFAPLDLWLADRGGVFAAAAKTEPLSLRGWINLPLFALVIAAIAGCAAWSSPVAYEVLGTSLRLPDLARDAMLLALALVSLLATPRGLRRDNEFEWEPVVEVAKLFAAIFVCIAPVLAMLQAGAAGPFAPLIALVTRPDGSADAQALFWASGLLSSVLDNAPTYLVFFDLAGGDPERLTGALAPALAAISLGAVFMGAVTYIGNAPNFMVYAIARRAGVKMPGFFGYLLWSGGILLPLFAVAGWLFLR